MSSKRYIIGAIVAALVVVGVIVAISVAGGDDEVTALSGADAVKTELKGIPQNGNTLGEPDAPVEIMEFGDTSCPACKAASDSVTPEVIETYVKTGKAKLSFHPIAFINASSERGALGAFAAADQNAMWSFVTLLYKNQAPESQPEWLTQKLMEEAAADLGLDAVAFTAAYEGKGVEAAFLKTKQLATEKGVTQTPTFVVKGPGGEDSFAGVENLSRFEQAMAKVGGS
ncbi:MAG: DsbA family protein [Thermoleophilia bacterium]